MFKKKHFFLFLRVSNSNIFEIFSGVVSTDTSNQESCDFALGISVRALFYVLLVPAEISLFYSLDKDMTMKFIADHCL